MYLPIFRVVYYYLKHNSKTIQGTKKNSIIEYRVVETRLHNFKPIAVCQSFIF